MIVFDGRKQKYTLFCRRAMGNGWDFCSTVKEDILTACEGWTSQVKLTRDIRVCEISRHFADKFRTNGGRNEKIAGWVNVLKTVVFGYGEHLRWSWRC